MSMVQNPALWPPFQPTTIAIFATAAAAPIANPAHSLWICLDHLILSAIISILFMYMISFIATTKTSRDVWFTLTNTYGKQSRGWILALKRLYNPLKGSKSIFKFLQEIKGVVDKLFLIGVTSDAEDLVFKILNGLDHAYHKISSAIQNHKHPIDFNEFHEKLLSTETQLHNCSLAAPTPHHSRQWRSTLLLLRTNRFNLLSLILRATTIPLVNPTRGHALTLASARLCGEMGHSVCRCSSFTYTADARSRVELLMAAWLRRLTSYRYWFGKYISPLSIHMTWLGFKQWW